MKRKFKVGEIVGHSYDEGITEGKRYIIIGFRTDVIDKWEYYYWMIEEITEKTHLVDEEMGYKRVLMSSSGESCLFRKHVSEAKDQPSWRKK